MNLTAGQTVTTQQAGVATTVTGTFIGTEGSFALVAWTTPTGRPVVGRFPLSNTAAA
jgi:hypothetical protein